MPRHFSSQELIQLGSTSMGEFGPSRVQMGVVSPCSTCKNQRSAPEGQKPMCPRRYWKAQDKAAAAAGVNGPDEYLTSSGADSDDSLANPVHSDSAGSVWVWVATLDDNQGVLDSNNGSLLTSSILDPGFDTDYIRCKQLPYVPEESRHTYAAFGRFKEGDRLKITTLPQYQSPTPGSRVSIGGFARKVDFHAGYTFQTPNKNTIASGF